MLFDGDCDFCRRWIVLWRSSTGDQVEYVPFRSLEVAQRFPEIKRESLEQAVHLLEPDGTVSRGAEAVFRSLAYAPGKRWALWFYRNIPGAASVMDFAYRVVAEHRGPFSALTRIFLPREPLSHALTGSLFLRLLGVVYLIAFISLGSQIIGLIGKNGVAPAGQFMQLGSNQLEGVHRFLLLPAM